MSLLSKSICLLGAYKTCVPLFNFGLHHYNNDYRSQYESIEERFRKYYGSTPDTPAHKKGWALITGGSDGIGKEYALLLAKSGFNIAVTGRSESKLASFKKELEDQGAAMVKTFSFDVSKCKDYSAITEDADLKSNLRVIINSVGMITSSHTFDSKPQDI
jgi:shikimate 5-dehydrogenase